MIQTLNDTLDATRACLDAMRNALDVAQRCLAAVFIGDCFLFVAVCLLAFLAVRRRRLPVADSRAADAITREKAKTRERLRRKRRKRKRRKCPGAQKAY